MRRWPPRSGLGLGLGLSLGSGSPEWALYQGSGWSYNPSTGLWSMTPVYGDNAILNPELTPIYVEDWTKIGTSTGLTRVDSASDPGVASGGSDNWCLKVTCALFEVSGTRIRSELGIPYGWYRYTAKVYVPTAFSVGVIIYPGNALGTDYATTITDRDSWVDYDVTGYDTAGGEWLYIKSTDATFVGDILYVDAAYKEQITNPFCVRNFGEQVGMSADIYCVDKRQAGVVVRYSDDSNYVVGYYDRAKDEVIIATVINTVMTLVNTAVAYVDGAVLEIKWAAPDLAQLWYNGSQVGSDVDVSSVPAGLKAGLFATK